MGQQLRGQPDDVEHQRGAHRQVASVDPGLLPAQDRVAFAQLALVDLGGASLQIQPPALGEERDRVVPDDRLDVRVGQPASRMAAAVLGTFSGSLTPQSAALFTMIRSLPYFFTSATIRASSILVWG